MGLHARMIDELGYDPDEPTVPRACDVNPEIGEIVEAREGDRRVAVARLASGRLVVVENRCPHDGGRISDGFVDGELIVCARHNWELAPCKSLGSGVSALRRCTR